MFPEPVEGAPGCSFYFLLDFLLAESIQGIADGLFDGLTLYNSGGVFLSARVDRGGFHFDIFLYLIFFVLLVILIGVDFVFEKLAVGESRKLLAQLHVLVLAVVITSLIESQVLGVSKPAVDILCF